MNSETIAMPRAHAGAAHEGRRTLSERLVNRTFSRFGQGGLRLQFPDGASRLLGAPEAEVTAEIRIRRRAPFFRRLALFGNIGLGEGYVEGDWDTPDIAAVITWFIRNLGRGPEAGKTPARIGFTDLLRLANRIGHLLRPNSLRTSRRNIAEHYDLGNDFFALWLDPGMTYSSARFSREGETLEDGQWAKFEALCQMLRLQPGHHLLEIGCGWGGFACHAAREHGCRVTAVTISREHYLKALERVRQEGLGDRIEVRLQDYRQLEGRFDRIASIEMLEAVGDRYLETFFGRCHALLKEDGLMALQYITVPDAHHARLRRGVDWIQKHIFPGSLLLSVGRVSEALRRTGDLFLHRLDDIGLSYARTLRIWHERFNEKLAEVRDQGFDERFIRKWNYYLKYCEAAFAARHISVVQACYTRPHNESALCALP